MLKINTSSLRHNYRFLSRETPAAAVVKANAYGLGIETTAPVFYQAGCREFFVAYPQEGVALRQYLTDTTTEQTTIYVLNGFDKKTFPIFTAHALTPVINAGEQLAILPDDWQLILQVETGMNRSGMMAIDAASITRPVDLLMSHLACADEPKNPLNAQQLAAFQHLTQQLQPARASLAASSGILLDKEYHFDLTRPGIGLYGGIDHPNLQHVVTWDVPILEVRRVPAGQPVGYGSTWLATQDSYIATLGAGYADGYPRSLSNKGMVEINGVSLPLSGRVSMDLLTVDVTPLIISAGVSTGTTVSSDTQRGHLEHLLNVSTATLYGDHYTINDAAKDAKTISYEILTRVHSRQHRASYPHQKPPTTAADNSFSTPAHTTHTPSHSALPIR